MSDRDLAKRWAPEIRFDAGEKYFPASVYYYLEHVSLKWERPSKFDKTIYKPGDMNRHNIKRTLIDAYAKKGGRKICSGDTSLAGNDKCTGFYLKNKDSEVKKGQDPDKTKVPSYANVVKIKDRIDIQYWLFYPSNHRLMETHEADWEHVTVRLDAAGTEIKKMYFAQHLGGGWVAKRRLIFNATGHPVVYCARGTHASYPAANMHSNIDPADGDGKIWRTHNDVRILGTKKQPTVGNEWLKYNGAWGRHFNQMGTGIPGPAYQTRWIKS